jgi:hypothetical protein
MKIKCRVGRGPGLNGFILSCAAVSQAGSLCGGEDVHQNKSAEIKGGRK